MSSTRGGHRARAAFAAAIAWLGLVAGAVTGGPFPTRTWAQQDTWTYYTDLRRVRGLALEADTMWVANSGGVLRFRRNQTPCGLSPANYRFYSAFDGLAGNNAVAVAVD